MGVDQGQQLELEAGAAICAASNDGGWVAVAQRETRVGDLQPASALCRRWMCSINGQFQSINS